MTETAQNLATPETLHCANHPDRETMLRCNRCDKPICFDCAVLTEVGYRCRECVRAQRAGYYNAAPTDAIIGALIAIGLGALFGLLAYLLLGLLGFFRLIAALLVGPSVGGLVAEAIRRALRKRRSPTLKWLAPLAFVLGVLLVSLFLGGFRGLAVRWDMLLFAGLGASTIYARML
jgi:hypothetical protein